MQNSNSASTSIGISESTFAKIWTGVGIVLVYFAFNSVLHIQGGKFFLPGLNLEKVERYSSALVAAPLISVGLLLFLYLTKLGLKQSSPPGVAYRLPLPLGWEVERTSPFGKLVLWTTYSALFVVPLVSMVLLLRKLYHGTGFTWDGSKRIASEWEHFTNFVPLQGNMYRFGDAKYGFEYFPGLQHWAYFVIGTVTFIFFAYVQYLTSFAPAAPSLPQLPSAEENDG